MSAPVNRLRRVVLSPKERDAQSRRLAAERAEREVVEAKERARFSTPKAVALRKAIMAAFDSGRVFSTPEMAFHLNTTGTTVSKGTVRQYLNRLADEDRIYATGLSVATYWGRNTRFTGEPIA